MFVKNGFRVIETFNVVNKYPLLYWLRMTPLPSPVKTLILHICKTTKIGFFTAFPKSR